MTTRLLAAALLVLTFCAACGESTGPSQDTTWPMVGLSLAPYIGVALIVAAFSIGSGRGK